MTHAAEPLEGTPLIKPSSTDHPLFDAVVDACRTVYDPEIPVNIHLSNRGSKFQKKALVGIQTSALTLYQMLHHRNSSVRGKKSDPKDKWLLLEITPWTNH